MNTHTSTCLFGEHVQPRRHQLSEGTSKIIYDGPEPGTHVLYFKDDALLNVEPLTCNGKGILNNRISELLMSRLNDQGIETHFIRTLNMREQLVRATTSLPFVVTVHNSASDAFAQRLGLEEGMILPKPVPEFSLRNNAVVAMEHLTALGWCRFEEIDEILVACQRVNDFLTGQFLALNMRLISFTLEYGRHYASDYMDSQIMITDELSPETFKLLDLTTGQRIDIQGIRNTPEKAQSIYQEVAHRLGVFTIDPSGKMPHTPAQDAAQVSTPLKGTFKKRNKPHGHSSF
ncbi:MAG: phosphoribosylaminoimidazolesuccinocarboxamide synthase [Alphaproteobacteria bacterium]|nr:phosphoribosylaminoimidazolesuccinocarboxamide synthase [Alphaproteobacteria bacterium]